jgi:hypothetical protein
VIRNFVSVGIDAQLYGSVIVAAEFPGSVIRDVWYLELPVERVSAVTAGCVTFGMVILFYWDVCL